MVSLLFELHYHSDFRVAQLYMTREQWRKFIVTLNSCRFNS